jgi:hypothetical protein
MVFIDGHLSGQARIITHYDGTTKTITLEEPLTSAPADGDQFLILATHENSVAEIADGVWNEAQSGHTTVGTFGYYLDAQVSAAGGGTPPTAAAIADAVWDEVRSPDHVTEGTFGYYVDAQVSSANRNRPERISRSPARGEGQRRWYYADPCNGFFRAVCV